MLVFRRTKKRYQIQAPLTSLIDIVFLLLIYFLLTTNFIVEEGINVKLPDAKASAPQVERDIIIYVDKAGRTFVGDEPIPVNQLYSRIKEMINGSTDRLVVVKADKTVVLNNVVKVMDTAKAAGASRLCLATEKGL
ncbi:MAG TPA: biopolymer transporter ExbD [Desulfobacteraceae bacterium]|nr:biopolymer transporter ExbD [Desulfobacteraceae bacterium]